MASGYIIRTAVASDAASIAQVHVDSWRSTYAELIDNEYLKSLSVERRQQMWTDVIAARRRGSHLYVVTTIDGQVVGFTSGGPNRDLVAAAGEDTLSPHRGDPDAEIYAIYLLVAHQKKGLGHQLLLRSLQRLQADGFHSCKVWVLKDNSATGFYGRLGARSYQEKMARIGDASYLETAYRWDSLHETLKAQIPNFRHGAIQPYSSLEEPERPSYDDSAELLSIGAPYSRFFDFDRIGIHHVTLLPGRRTSWPHAESTEDEFAFILEGNPHVWIDGELYPLKPGDGVGFKAGSGITHTFMNQSQEKVRLLVVGDRTRSDNRVYYAVHPDANEKLKQRGFFWDGHPVRRTYS